ncbi:hypothetical protein KO493_07070 [Tamlana agarivorans]|uniref:Uncharacterized protein n=1 Tax=Pseudotamlana agarivorans TaxID=481183 RepID=A0ACC5U7Z9_9FLAO|nr:LamG-like jellyroll fold domain-containing protein [Tamlana agarivorans]MBU2950452.1 hypothetical protein [Tamlana agarivorans]
MLKHYSLISKHLLLLVLFLSAPILLFAQDGKARIYNEVSGTRGPLIPDNNPPASITYGTDFGNSAGTKTFIITRDDLTGNSEREIGDMQPITITGDPQFSITENLKDSDDKLTSGQTDTFEITYDGSGPATATVTFEYTWHEVSNGSDVGTNTGTTYTFQISGGGGNSGSVYPDTDGDGVSDNLDIDDDNDGIADDVEDDICENRSHGTAEVVMLNEDFGTGTNRARINENFPGATTEYTYEDGSGGDDLETLEYAVYHDASDNALATWASGDWGAAVDHTDDDPSTVGRMAIFNGNNNNQVSNNSGPYVVYEATINGLTPGKDIYFSFYAVNLDVKDPSTYSNTRYDPQVSMELFDVTDPANPQSIGSATSIPLPRNPTHSTPFGPDFWTHTENTITGGTITAIKVRLVDITDEGSGNDFAIDDIRVTQLFCDSDGDNIPDTHDIDDDNDGIPNVVELSFSGDDSDKDGTLYGTGWVDTDNNGMHDNYESNIGDIDDALDSDNDGTPNYLDLDSDNDGIFDTLEYDGLGDIDVTGNGLGDGPDTDGDGVLDTMDTLDGFGLNGYDDPIKTTSGIPDYLNIKSNGADYDILAIDHLYPNLDGDNNGVIDGSTDADQDGIMDGLDSDTGAHGSPRAIDGSYSLYFDGRNDYVETPEFLNNASNGTMMCWVNIDASGFNTQEIMGQENISLVYSSGDVKLVVNSAEILSAPIIQGKWVNIACAYSSGDYGIYINGENKDTLSGSPLINGTGINFRIGKTPTGSAFFKGQIDEVRVFNETLTPTDIQHMMCQELDENNNFTVGKIIPREINPSLSTSLIRYYKMDTYTDDQLIDLSTSGVDATIYNVKEIYFQTAPMPFETVNDGDWNIETTWLHGDVWDIWGNAPNNYPIVRIKNHVTTSQEQNTIGLLINNDASLEVQPDVALNNSWYLDIGTKGTTGTKALIDLQGESQLIQTQDSKLEEDGEGYLQRDQQGTVNKYSYNYWSSPVHSSSGAPFTYTVKDVLKNDNNGSDPTVPIDFVSGYDGDDSSTPVKIAEYWINVYNNVANNYWKWNRVLSTGTINAGEGFTMKGPGSGPIGTEINYVFEGIPNNGSLELGIFSGNEYLIGNPYPSAIDANLFISDNQGVITGSLYYWEHVGGGSHFLADYEGSYGTYNLSGAAPHVTAPSAIPPIANVISTKLPKQYIPVAQGFFVEARNTNIITFQNSQRIFKTEGTESVFIKETNTKTSKTTNVKTGDTRPKIRLKYSSPLGYQRQLLTTVDTSATQNVDWGYDAKLIEDLPEDMSWEIENDKYVIQGIDTIEASTILPLIVKTREKASDNGGIVTFSIDSLQNDAQNYNVYLKDFDTYHDLKQAPYDATVSKGETIGRFALAFSDQTLNIEEESNKLGVKLFYNKQNTSLIINNPKNTTLKSLTAVNTLGQMVYSKQLNTSENRLEIPTHLATGLYVFSVQTENIELSKKVIVAE